MIVAVECTTIAEWRDIERQLHPLLAEIAKISFLVYIDEKKKADAECIATTQSVVLFREDLSWKMTPSVEIVENIQNQNVDVFVNLCKEPSFVIDFMTRISNAKMRIGFAEKIEITELQIGLNKAMDFSAFFNKALQLMKMVTTKAC